MIRLRMLPIHALPLPPRPHTLTSNLTAESSALTASALPKLLRSTPSSLRRSRILPPSVHFAYVTPLPIPFPYDISAPEGPVDDGTYSKGEYVERWLTAREPLDEVPPVDTGIPTSQKHLSKYTSSSRTEKRVLLALSSSCLKEWLPLLDVGDAFDHLGEARLAVQENNPAKVAEKGEDASTREAVREELVDVLSGQSVLMHLPAEDAPNEDGQTGYAPWSLRYCGHQFGLWAGQLGDGRAISLLETPHPDDPGTIYELQLKGAGRTPFSRSADGLAVLRSSVREFLGAEAMHALRVPTTRSLALISLPDLQVEREETETASIVTRVAPSFIRVGNFQATNPPEQVMLFYLGSGSSSAPKADWEAMRILGEWVSRRVLKLDGFGDGRPWGKDLVWECARRNAKMVAGWQAYGYENGVMNTDNISIAGLTIDYGPYAFMDVYDKNWVCNHTDAEGRYAFKNQPSMIVYAMKALLTSLSPLIGAESQLKHAVGPQWAESATSEQLSTWKTDALELSTELEQLVYDVYEVEFRSLMRKRLGLRKDDPQDQSLIESLVDLLQRHQLDYSSTLRTLTKFRPMSENLADHVSPLLSSLVKSPNSNNEDNARADWLVWLEKFGTRIEIESGAWKHHGADWPSIREKEMKEYNPRFVLRQWVLEELIERLQEDSDHARPALLKVLEMTTNPFHPWGAEDDTRPDSELEEEEKAERRFCGLGPKRFLGFQCSCSS